MFVAPRGRPITEGVDPAKQTNKQTKDARRQTGPDGTDETGTDETGTTTAREGRSRTQTPASI